MFIAWSREVKNERYLVHSNRNACPNCKTERQLILNKETTIWKLFWLIPIFWITHYTLQCPTCGMYIKITKADGKVLEDLSLHQKYTEEGPGVSAFAEFDNTHVENEREEGCETTQSTTEKQSSNEANQDGNEQDRPTEQASLHADVAPMSAFTIDFAEKIYNLRRSLYMSQEQFGDAIGVSRQTVCKWELNKAQPDEKNLRLMLMRFSLPNDYFTRADNVAPPQKSETQFAENNAVNAYLPPSQQRNTQEKTGNNRKLLLALAIMFGAVLLIFNIVITAIHMPGYIQFPIFWFYIGGFIAANAMLIPVGICLMAKRKISASIISFISYMLISVFTLWGCIPNYVKPETRTIHSNETFTQSMYIPAFPQGVNSDEFWSAEGNTFIFEFVNAYHISLRFTWKEAEGGYRVENTYVTLYGIDYDGEEVMLESGYLLANHWFAYDFTLNFNTYPSYKMTYSHEGIAYFRLTWEENQDAINSTGQ